MKKEELEIVVERAQGIFKKIKARYAGLSGFLVLASPPGTAPWGQCVLTSDLLKILKGITDLKKDERDKQADIIDKQALPNMIHDSKYKEKAIELIAQISELERDRKISFSIDAKKEVDKEVEKLSNTLASLVEHLEIKDDILVEIRFDRLFYDLIFELQKDLLVSQKHTPQTRASIRIVLGTIEELYHKEVLLNGGS